MPTTGNNAERTLGQRTANTALTASVGATWWRACLVLAAMLAASWLATYSLGGVDRVVPHWYYVPILFAAARFGPVAAIVVALVSGVLAGPLTLLDVAAGTTQPPARWITRMGFFVVIGVMMAWLVRPSLPSVTAELQRFREERRLRAALEGGELFLRYQPIMHLSTGKVYGFEALIRWQHPERGEIGPAEFLPIAERSDIIHDLGRFVLREACATAVTWAHLAAERRQPVPCVTVNMSARELESPTLITDIRDQLAGSGIDPQRVCIEVTESSLVNDLDLSIARLAGLRSLGVRIAVDDFGTGYSSLSAVHRFPIDVVKIDRSFVSSLHRHADTATLLGGLVLLARSLGLISVAEGIETDDELSTLTALDFELGQGYRFDPPLTEAEVGEFLKTSVTIDVPLPTSRSRDIAEQAPHG